MYASRKELEAALYDVLQEELPEKNRKERLIIAEAIIATLDGEFLDIVEDDVDDEEELTDDEDEDEEYNGN